MLSATVASGCAGSFDSPDVIATARRSLGRLLGGADGTASLYFAKSHDSVTTSLAGGPQQLKGADGASMLLLYCLGSCTVRAGQLLFAADDPAAPAMDVCGVVKASLGRLGAATDSPFRLVVIVDGTCLETPVRMLAEETIRTVVAAASFPVDAVCMVASRAGEGAIPALHEAVIPPLLSLLKQPCPLTADDISESLRQAAIGAGDTVQASVVSVLGTVPAPQRDGPGLSEEQAGLPQIGHSAADSSAPEEHPAAWGYQAPEPPLLQQQPRSQPTGPVAGQPHMFWCECCSCTICGASNWAQHVQSERHQRKAVAKEGTGPVIPTGVDATQLLIQQNAANYFNCDICGTIISGEANIQQHVQGSKHRKKAAEKGLVL